MLLDFVRGCDVVPALFFRHGTVGRSGSEQTRGAVDRLDVVLRETFQSWRARVEKVVHLRVRQALFDELYVVGLVDGQCPIG